MVGYSSSGATRTYASVVVNASEEKDAAVSTPDFSFSAKTASPSNSPAPSSPIPIPSPLARERCPYHFNYDEASRPRDDFAHRPSQRFHDKYRRQGVHAGTDGRNNGFTFGFHTSQEQVGETATPRAPVYTFSLRGLPSTAKDYLSYSAGAVRDRVTTAWRVTVRRVVTTAHTVFAVTLISGFVVLTLYLFVASYVIAVLCAIAKRFPLVLHAAMRGASKTAHVAFGAGVLAFKAGRSAYHTAQSIWTDYGAPWVPTVAPLVPKRVQSILAWRPFGFGAASQEEECAEEPRPHLHNEFYAPFSKPGWKASTSGGVPCQDDPDGLPSPPASASPSVTRAYRYPNQRFTHPHRRSQSSDPSPSPTRSFMDSYHDGEELEPYPTPGSSPRPSAIPDLAEDTSPSATPMNVHVEEDCVESDPNTHRPRRRASERAFDLDQDFIAESDPNTPIPRRRASERAFDLDQDFIGETEPNTPRPRRSASERVYSSNDQIDHVFVERQFDLHDGQLCPNVHEFPDSDDEDGSAGNQGDIDEPHGTDERGSHTERPRSSRRREWRWSLSSSTASSDYSFDSGYAEPKATRDDTPQ
ncbi:uncharacterized protein EV422DRAFT_125235 [Fimicolochytrium jonesii]|uniref:uncharacterized protein n=1 Tax=Fimicolochytrium jonesii TaxID=1396493 RepID=UPI0022FF1260|nr:uncharacterized protein EV422DRAFT_125235 [Fimicolochytrium jonesii]KAI8818922.1 hypothetical protein EV422DRAFT_125235 [Fimicolochytrium jonesii]